MSFKEFVQKNKFQNKQTSNIKRQQVLSSLFLTDVGIYLRDGPFLGEIGVVNLNPSKRTHWVVSINKKYFDSYGWALPRKLCNFF